MYRKLLSALMIGVALLSNAQNIKFDNNKQLKIVQFADNHYACASEAESQPALDCLNTILDAEKPDLVVFTGDLVYSAEAYKGIDKVLEPVISRKIPFAVTFGNHDNEFDRTITEVYDYVAAKPYCLMPTRKKDANVPDYTLKIKSNDGKKDAAVLYCLYSHSYNKEVGYEWLTCDQVQWYRNESKAITKKNGGKPLPALAFYHIPIPEYATAAAEAGDKLKGNRGETECCPKINSGLFAAVLECGDIMGMFVGHDHNNDYATYYNGVLMAYGRYSGGKTVYNDLPNGARIIILKEGSREIETYIRQTDGKIIK